MMANARNDREIGGQVVDENGKGMVGVQVHATVIDAQGATHQLGSSKRTNPQGYFIIRETAETADAFQLLVDQISDTKTADISFQVTSGTDYQEPVLPGAPPTYQTTDRVVDAILVMETTQVAAPAEAITTSPTGGATSPSQTPGSSNPSSTSAGGTPSRSASSPYQPGPLDLTDLIAVLNEMVALNPTAHETGTRSGKRYSNGTTNLQSIVDEALLEVLGRHVSLNDPRAIREALTQVFPETIEDERYVYHWTPRTYIVQTELGGALSGAQASLYQRAQRALDDILPLLDGLHPLSPTADEEEMEACRATVRQQIIELVNELGYEGTPRVQRVTKILEVLLGANRTSGEWAILEETFGLSLDNVVTVDEERMYTDSLIIGDYLRSLAESWDRFVEQGESLGGTLMILSRSFAVVAESVDELISALDAVAIGPHERQLIAIDDEPNEIYLGDLLDWINHFATEEGPALARSGGIRGLETVITMSDELARLVGNAKSTPALQRQRVLRALDELLEKLDGLADEVQTYVDSRKGISKP
jgi:hypothetical protein